MKVGCDDGGDGVLKMPRDPDAINSNEESSTAEDDDTEVMMDNSYNHDDPENIQDADQLPNVEEYKANAPPSAGVRNTRKRFRIISISACLLLVVLIILISLLSGKERSKEPSSSNSDNQQQNNNDNNDQQVQDEIEKRFTDLLNMIGRNRKWSSLDDLNSPNTPQREALTWLASIDPLQLPVDQESQQLMQRYVLAVFYFSLNGITWSNDYSFLSKSGECDWSTFRNYGTNANNNDIEGVLCDTDTTITRLYIANNDLYGSLPSEIRLLTALREINFYNNEIYGTIPTEFAKLSNLVSIVLHQNEIEDTFPTWVTKLSNLKILNLGDNDIEGELPIDFNKTLSSLTTFNCESCLLQGDLMPLYGMSQLESLHLGDNAFNMSFSNDLLDSWTNLIELDLGFNSLNGPLPTSLFIHPNLTIIDLHDNEFEGNLTKTDTMLTKSKLRVLALHGNRLSGEIDPNWVNTLTDIQHLDLSENDFVGAIPTEFGNLNKLIYLFLALNPFDEGNIPTQLGLLTNLVDLSLQSTSRVGRIPTELGHMERLVMLDLLNNTLTGPIPSQLGNLTNVRYVFLGQNRLSGDIPTTLANLDNLDILILSSNENFTSGIDEFCDVQEPRVFQADCSKLNTSTNTCTCCTCCLDSDDPVIRAGCLETSYFFNNIDPSVEYNYVRQFYQFDDVQGVYGIPYIFATNESDDTELFDNAPYNNNFARPWEEYIEDNGTISQDGEEYPLASLLNFSSNGADVWDGYDDNEYDNKTDNRFDDYEGLLNEFPKEADEIDGINGTP